MKELPITTQHTWDFIIEQRKVVKQIADVLNVSEDYLVYQTHFLKAVTKANKILAIKAINSAIRRFNEL